MIRRIFWWIIMSIEEVSNDIHWWAGNLLAARQRARMQR